MFNTNDLSLILSSAFVLQSSLYTTAHANLTESPLYNFKSCNFDTNTVTYDETKPILLHKYGQEVLVNIQ